MVKNTFDGPDKPKAVILWYERDDWRRPDNEARTKWNVQNLPTILRMEDVSARGCGSILFTDRWEHRERKLVV